MHHQTSLSVFNFNSYEQAGIVAFTLIVLFLLTIIFKGSD